MNDTAKEKLRVGFVLDSADIPEWLSELISDLANSSTATTCLLIHDSSAVININNSSVRHLLYDVYSLLEKKRFEKNEQGQNLNSQTQEVTQSMIKIPIDLKQPKLESLEQLASYQLDVLINLSTSNLSAILVELKNCALWMLRCCDPLTRMYTIPAGFWEVYNNKTVIESSLVMLFSDATKDRSLSKNIFATDVYNSVERNRSNTEMVNKVMIRRNLEKLKDLGIDEFINQSKNIVEADRIRRDPFHSDKPGNFKMFYFLSKRLFNSIKMRFMNALFIEQWAMRYNLSTDVSMDFSRFEKLIPSASGLWADPFIYYHESTYYLFFEDAIYDRENADISVMEIGENGSRSNPKPCLVRPYHLSYPFVFHWEGEHYMIPETKSNNAIEVFRATNFPNEWVAHSQLMEDIEAVDTTLLFHNKKWWLFTSIKSGEQISINNELSIFYADSPLSKEWTAHPMNPVITDVRGARSAGRIYQHQGKLIRPSQDSSVRYGYGLRLNEIKCLTETQYEEQEINYIEPNWGKMLRGIHTIAHEKNLTVIDVLEWRFRFF